MIRPARSRGTRRRSGGMSLVEMVTVIVLTGVLSVGLAGLLRNPMNGYLAVSRRTELVALANLALSRMTRDLRHALPNSVRVAGGGAALELMHTRAGGRYRADPGVNDPGGPDEEDHTDPSDWLSFGGDTSWNVLGRFSDLPVGYGTPLPAGSRVAIYPTGSGIWARAATGADPGPITPAATTIRVFDDGDEDQLQLATSHRFSLTSPSARVYLVDTPVSYVCDPSDASLWRIDGYTIEASQPTDRTALPLSGGQAHRAADRVESCSFAYDPGTPTRSGIVTLEIVLMLADERVRLLQQVQVQNVP